MKPRGVHSPMGHDWLMPFRGRARYTPTAKQRMRAEHQHARHGHYLPHQGRREMLRRRQGGNATRIRMERAGFAWNDVAGKYERGAT